MLWCGYVTWRFFCVRLHSHQNEFASCLAWIVLRSTLYPFLRSQPLQLLVNGGLNLSRVGGNIQFCRLLFYSTTVSMVPHHKQKKLLGGRNELMYFCVSQLLCWTLKVAWQGRDGERTAQRRRRRTFQPNYELLRRFLRHLMFRPINCRNFMISIENFNSLEFKRRREDEEFSNCLIGKLPRIERKQDRNWQDQFNVVKESNEELWIEEIDYLVRW